MPSFSSLFTSLTNFGLYYEKSSRHASYNFGQESRSLYRNQPRFPFEYYIALNLNQVGTAKQYIDSVFNSTTLQQIPPLVKSVEMPSMKIETTPLNQYNRKRISQTKVTFEPVKIVFHDVADGKTLKFWEMYYRYYFADGNEPGINDPVQVQQKNAPMSIETLLHNVTPALNPNIANLPSSIEDLFQGKTPTDANSATNTNGSKQDLTNIVSDTLDNHNFGFNLPQVQGIRNLIQSIDIYQVHGGKFNCVTLVNPRIASFTHDTLNYATGDKTLELTFSFEYEYAYYTIQNLNLGGNADGTQPQNFSTIDQFTHGEFLELPALAFNAKLMDFIESNNPLLNSDNPILQSIGKNAQSSIGATTGAFLSNTTRRVTSSVLNGLANISPQPYHPTSSPAVTARSFASAAKPTSVQYKDMNRTGGNGG
jgi:hypothetical protein